MVQPVDAGVKVPEYWHCLRVLLLLSQVQELVLDQAVQVVPLSVDVLACSWVPFTWTADVVCICSCEVCDCNWLVWLCCCDVCFCNWLVWLCSCEVCDCSWLVWLCSCEICDCSWLVLRSHCGVTACDCRVLLRLWFWALPPS